MIPKPLFDTGTALFGISLVLVVLGLRAAHAAAREAELPVIGSLP